MSPLELQSYLHQHIPLSRAMQVAVSDASPAGVTLRAPLAPNINHRETVFGGSASALAILAAWSLLHVRLRAEGIDTRLVIQRNTMAYDDAMAGEFSARSALPDAAQWPLFTRMLARRGKARISVVSTLSCEGRPAGRLTGDFVALGHSEMATRAAPHPVQARQIDHVVLRVRNLPAMLAFYRDVLGCTPERDQPQLGLYQLRAGSSLIDLVPVDEPLGRLGGAPPGREGHNLDHFCLRLDPFDAGAIAAHLRAHGVEPGPVESRYGAEGEGPSIYLRDPEGNGLELKGPATFHPPEARP